MSNKIVQDKSLIKDVNTKTCYPCKEGSSKELCRPFPSSNSDVKCKEQCKEQCRDQYNASSYYYDKDGTKHCYCGKTKSSCEQMANVKVCDNNSDEQCELKEGLFKEKYVNEISNQKECQDECKKILNSDGLYCKDNMKCICKNPNSDSNFEKLIENYTEATNQKFSCDPQQYGKCIFDRSGKYDNIQECEKNYDKDCKGKFKFSCDPNNPGQCMFNRSGKYDNPKECEKNYYKDCLSPQKYGKCLPGEQLYCKDGNPIKTKDPNFPSSYFDFSKKDFLGQDTNTNQDKLTAFCGCDNGVLKEYKQSLISNAVT